MNFFYDKKNLLRPQDIVRGGAAHSAQMESCVACRGWDMPADNPLGQSDRHDYRTELVAFDDATYAASIRRFPKCRRAQSPSATLAAIKEAVSSGRSVTLKELRVWRSHYDERVPLALLKNWHLLRQQVDGRIEAFVMRELEHLASRVAPCFCSSGYDLRVPLLDAFLIALQDEVLSGDFPKLRRSLFTVRDRIQQGCVTAARLVGTSASLVRLGLLDDVGAFDAATHEGVLRFAPERAAHVLRWGGSPRRAPSSLTAWALDVLGGAERLNEYGVVPTAVSTEDDSAHRAAWTVLGHGARYGYEGLAEQALGAGAQSALRELYESLTHDSLAFPAPRLVPLPSDLSLSSQEIANDVYVTQRGRDWHAHLSLQRPLVVTLCVPNEDGTETSHSFSLEDSTAAVRWFNHCVQHGPAALPSLS